MGLKEVLLRVPLGDSEFSMVICENIYAAWHKGFDEAHHKNWQLIQSKNN